MRNAALLFGMAISKETMEQLESLKKTFSNTKELVNILSRYSVPLSAIDLKFHKKVQNIYCIIKLKIHSP